MSSLPPSRAMPLSKSDDGHIRVTFAAFSRLDFHQRRTWEDSELCRELVQGDLPAFHAGYCEWATERLREQVIIGWAWFRTADGQIRLAPGGVSSNVMFVAGSFHDLGSRKTDELRQSWLTGESWRLEATLLDRPPRQRRLGRASPACRFGSAFFS